MKAGRRAERVESVGATYAIAKVVLLYAVFAALWILLSDKLVGLIFDAPAHVEVVSTLKGWVFVAVTSLLLWLLMRRLVNQRLAREPELDFGSRSSLPVETSTTDVASGIGFRLLLTWPFFLLAFVVVTLVLGGIGYTMRHHKEREVTRLQAIASLKTSQISAWLWERQGDAEFVHGSRFFAELYRRWRDEGDLSSRQRLAERLREYQGIYRYQNVLVLDERGEVVLATAGGAIPDLMPPLRAAARRAIAERRVVDTDLYRNESNPTILYLDFVAPLPTTGDRAGPAIVLRVDLEVSLYPLLRSWPIPSASAETHLFRREDDRVVFLNNLHRFSGAVAPSSLPVTAERSLVARALRGAAEPGGVVEGVDYRGILAVGVINPIPGTDWFLIAKLDRDELYGPAKQDAIWIVLAGVLALFAVAAFTVLLQQGRQLRLSLLRHQQEAERTASLQQLANERGRLRALIQTIPDLVWLKDPDGIYLDCNPAFERFFGAKETEIVGKTDYDFVSTELADFFRQKDREAIVAGKPSVNEEWITFADDGRRALLETIKTPIWDVEGKLVGVLGIGRDITGRKRMEEALRASEARFRNLFENSPIAYQSLDIAGRFVDVNQKLCNLLGYRADELLGRDFGEFWSDGIRSCFPDTFDRFKRNDQVSGELHLIRKDGGKISVILEGRIQRDPEGHFVRTHCILTDITERRRIEEELRFQAMVLNQIEDKITVTDLRGIVTYVNDAVCRRSKRSREEIIGHPVESYGEDSARGATQRQIVEATLADGEWRGEVVNSASDGTGSILDCRARLVRNAEGLPVALCGISTDITERKRAEEQIKRYVQIVETSGDLLAFVDRDQRYRVVNAAYAALFQSHPESLQGHRVEEILGSEMYAWIKSKLERALAGEDQRFVVERTFPDGRLHVLDAEYRPFLAEGEVAGVVVSMRDITDRKRMEEALRASEARYRTLFDSMTEGFAIHEIVLDESGKPCDYRFLDVNASFERLTGLKRGDILGRRVHEIVPNLEPHWIERYGNVALTGEPAYFESYSGDLSRWYEVYAYRSAPQQFAAIIMDVTARHLVEEELHKLSLAVEQSPESIVITGLDGRIEYVNAAFVAVSGYRPEEALGQNPRILASGKTPAATFVELWDRLAKGEAWQGEFVNRRKNGEDYVEFARIAPIRQPDGRITHYLAIKADITEKKRLELEVDRHRHHLEERVAERTAQLAEARERAEAANRAKSLFLANISHEIRTPMNAIIGFAHLLQRDRPTPEQFERLGKIDEAARHLLTILNDVLDLSKIEAGRLELERIDFPLAIIFDHVRSLVIGQAKAKGLVIEVDSGGVPTWLRGDPTRLRQALLNYASNAVKFTQAGVVTLRAKLLEERDDAVWVRFEVQDTGIGLAPDELPRLFGAFEQVDASITRRHGGTGLGLAITRRLAELMGGEAGVDSVLGRGSTFWFTVRLERGHSLRPIVPTGDEGDIEAELRRRSAGARLLLVEDNPINQEVALELLRAVGFVVDLAEDGQSAVDRARTTRYDLILMDVQMPVLDGLEATRAIRRISGYGRAPILAMTANAFEEDRRTCFAAGMTDHVGKPVDPDALFAALLKWLPERPEQVALEAETRPSGRVKVATAMDWEQACAVLNELDALLVSDDIRANAVFRKSAPLLRVVLGDAANKIERQLDVFEYEQALHALRKALAERWEESDA